MSILGDLVGSAASASPIGSILDIGSKLIDRLVPDPQAAADMKLKLAQLGQNGQLAELAATTDISKAQIDTDKVEAASPSIWVSGWRPFIGWCGGAGFAVQFVLIPFAGYCSALMGYHAPPPIQVDPILMQVLLGILGLNIGLHTYEKVKGV